MNFQQTVADRKGSRVAFQGEHGAFSEQAISLLFPCEVATVPCHTFDDLFAAVPQDRAEFALVPLENTLAGNIPRCYELLYQSELTIHAEAILPIHHCIIGCEGATLDHLRAVQSHPVALDQCESFFRTHPHIQRKVAEDTAGSVRDVVERNDPALAAIAGEHAARVYGGSILLRNVEDYPENLTRFGLLAPGMLGRGGDKRSLAVKLKHYPGGLYAALAPFAKHQINLLNIICRPIKGRPWEYLFFIDLAASGTDDRMAEAMRELEGAVEEMKVLGAYASAGTPVST
ncbi:MAG TPA: prephenate dehydratase [Clostridia bacterium]|nr:prephenate dehydratase [Clostridia bacterium]